MTGKELGPALIDAGAKAYIGYDAPFVFGVWKEGVRLPAPCTPPSDNADLYSFGRCDLEVQGQLANGRTVGESVAASREMFDDYIERYETGDWSDRPVAP